MAKAIAISRHLINGTIYQHMVSAKCGNHPVVAIRSIKRSDHGLIKVRARSW